MTSNNPTTRGVIFVSMGARVMTPSYLCLVAQTAQALGCTLTAYLLDEPEILNLINLHQIPPKVAAEQVRQRSDEMVALLSATLRPGAGVARWSDFVLQQTFRSYLEALSREFENEPEFRKHCRNQVFRNLYPVLRRSGVRNNRDERTCRLAPYLLQEIALKLYLANEQLADVEFAPEPEMELVQAIYDGKYAALKSLTVHRLRHMVVRSPLEENLSSLCGAATPMDPN